jgi:hypothetical protein
VAQPSLKQPKKTNRMAGWRRISVARLAFWTSRSRHATSILMKLTTMIQNYPVDMYG